MIVPLIALSLFAGPPPQDSTYFQQGVSYRIEASLDEPAQVLHGRARMRYVNHAPATLDTLWFHQYLNAFRPNSAWARRELEFGVRRFQDLGPTEHGFERFTAPVRVDGTPVEPVYPFSPDSTVTAVPLPHPLAPGDSVVVDMSWDARPSTIPRRQGRRGRHWDFAQWYPRIAAYDQDGWEYHVLLPQGEFYGEFAHWDVTLDVAADQVIGATGVPVQGDPGWEKAATPGQKVEYARDAYPAPTPESLGLLTGSAAAGRKRVRWIADDVHHFAWSTAPDYIYEGGRAGKVLIHVLYQPGDTAWSGGVAVERSRVALEWLESKLGPYPYAQITNLHRIEGGGTEFPMMVMNGGASLGLIQHEFTHQWAMGILASNEWKHAWQDEGFADFMTAWAQEERGDTTVWQRALPRLAQLERTGTTQPMDTPAADFRDYRMYSAMSYSKGGAFFHMMRGLLGDEAFGRGLMRYSLHNRFRHVTPEDLRRAMEQASGEDLGWFFHEWLDTTLRLDWGIGDASTRQTQDGWVTRVEVIRGGQAWMPVTLQVGMRRHRLTSRNWREVVEVRTTEEPHTITLDPDYALLDVDRTNNVRELR